MSGIDFTTTRRSDNGLVSNQECSSETHLKFSQCPHECETLKSVQCLLPQLATIRLLPLAVLHLVTPVEVMSRPSWAP
jgi:hypothetical protein